MTSAIHRSGLLTGFLGLLMSLSGCGTVPMRPTSNAGPLALTRPVEIYRVSRAHVLLPSDAITKATVGTRIGTLAPGTGIRRTGSRSWDTATRGIIRTPYGVITSGPFAGTEVSLGHRGIPRCLAESPSLRGAIDR
ncbi:MAG: hypothetical protein L7V86_06115 [Verrucomicrobiales bacterium]|nr:hypothetical protein [Verrucomicrobiales bacterium]